MTSPDWGPQVTTRKLGQPVVGQLGAELTDVPSAVTWIRAPGAPAQPEAVAEPSVALTPMPETDLMIFPAVQTYSNGTIVRWTDPPGATAGSSGNGPAIVLMLEPQTAFHEPAPVGGEAGNTAGTADDGSSSPYGVLGAGVIIGLVAGLLVAGLVAWRRRRQSAPAGPADSSPEADRTA